MEFRHVFLRCMPDCQKHLNPNVKFKDWDHVRIPMMFAVKWLAICAFERPRIAKLCSTKYETFYKGNSDTKSGRIVVDKVIGITAIQGHTYGESANHYQLLGWHKVTQVFTGIHIFFGFHQTSLENFYKIIGSEGIIPGGPAHVSSGWRGTRDMVYCSRNDPTSVSSRQMTEVELPVLRIQQRFISRA